LLTLLMLVTFSLFFDIVALLRPLVALASPCRTTPRRG